MSRVSEVIKNKNKTEKDRRNRRKSEISRLRIQTAYKAKLYDELKRVDIILEDKDVEAVVVKIPDRVLAHFTNALYSEDLIGYSVTQVEGKPNEFEIRRKFIVL